MTKSLEKLPTPIKNLAVFGLLGAGVLSGAACDYNGDGRRNETEIEQLAEQNGGERLGDDLYIRAGVNVRSQPEIANLGNDADGQENVVSKLKGDVVLQDPKIIVNEDGQRFAIMINDQYDPGSNQPADRFNYVSLALLGQEDENGKPYMGRIPISKEEQERRDSQKKGAESTMALPGGWN